VSKCVKAVEPALLSVPPDGLEVTAYPVMDEPPLLAGALKVTLASAFPAVATAEVGTPGMPIGVTGFDADEGELVPTELTAYTAKLYDVPFVRPVTVIGEPVDVAVKLPGVDDAR
jgi:hypothetical protein